MLILRVSEVLRARQEGCECAVLMVCYLHVTCNAAVVTPAFTLEEAEACDTLSMNRPLGGPVSTTCRATIGSPTNYLQ